MRKKIIVQRTGWEAATVFDTDSGWLAIGFKDRQASKRRTHAYACAQLDVARRSECERWTRCSGRRGTGGGDRQMRIGRLGAAATRVGVLFTQLSVEL